MESKKSVFRRMELELFLFGPVSPPSCDTYPTIGMTAAERYDLLGKKGPEIRLDNEDTIICRLEYNFETRTYRKIEEVKPQ